MAKKERPAGTKTYLLGAPHYRLGKYYEVGETITVPATETPSKTWVEVDEDGDPVEAAPKASQSAGVRMADESLKHKKADEPTSGKGASRPNDRTIG